MDNNQVVHDVQSEFTGGVELQHMALLAGTLPDGNKHVYLMAGFT